MNPPKILLVDDEENVLRGYERILRKEFSIFCATSGQAGLEILQREGPLSVVVSDFRMPGMNGIEFLGRVLALSPETTRIMLTGHADFENTVAAVNEGNLFRLLIKPCPFERLSRAISDGIYYNSLIRSQREMIAIIETTSDIIFIANVDGTVMYLNSAGINSLGSGAIGKTASSLLTRESAEVVMNQGIPGAIRNGTWSGDALMLDRNLAQIPVSLQVIAHKAGHGKVDRFSFMIRDIFAKKKIEETLSRQSRELMETRDRALEAVKVKASFLSNMSMELRTPLNSIIGLSSLLSDSPLDEEQKQFTSLIQSSGEALLALINDMLDSARIESDTQEISIIDFPLRPLLEDLIQEYGEKAFAKGVETSLLVSSEIPTMLASAPSRLKQILSQLLSNAVKFTHQGEISLTVRSTDGPDSRLYLRFEIVDSGVGIPEHLHATLLPEQLPAKENHEAKKATSNLGLFIARGLTTMLGGTIGFTSAPSIGSTFHVTIPFATATPESPSNIRSIDYSGKTALIIDDSEASRMILENQLSAFGFSTHQVTSGKRGLESIRQLAQNRIPLDVAIIDQNLPDMSGIALGEAIRKISPFQDLPMILLSSTMRFGHSLKAKEAGFDAYLVKPASLEILSRCFRSMFIRKHSTSVHEPLASISPLNAGARSIPSVLLVDDTSSARRLGSLILEREGCRVTTAKDGREAMELLAREPFNIVFLDLIMPGMSGQETLQAIRSSEGPMANIPIVALTGCSVDSGIEHAEILATGFDAIIDKPLTPDKARNALDSFIPGIIPEKAPANVTTPARPDDSASLQACFASLAKTFDQAAIEQIWKESREIIRQTVREATASPEPNQPLFDENQRALLRNVCANLHLSQCLKLLNAPSAELERHGRNRLLAMLNALADLDIEKLYQSRQPDTLTESGSPS